LDFREADRRYAEIKRRHEAGALNDQEFDEQLKQLMVQDQEERWWSKSRRTGDWHFYDGTTWIKDTPPGYEPPQAAPQVSSPPRGGPSTTPAQAPSSPRSILLRWLGPLAAALVGLVVIVVVIVVAIASNTGGDGDYAGGGGSATPPPTSSVLFSDDFSDTSSGWPETRGKDSGNYYDDGGYRTYTKVNGARYTLISEAGVHQDVVMKVDAKVLNSQTEDIAAGVICRVHEEEGNYYALLVFANGYVRINKYGGNNVIREIAEGDRSDMIGGNVVSPHIRGDCIGNTLTLYVNGQRVLEAEDSEYGSGKVGLLANAGSDSTSGADILFDNFLAEKS
jgi:hypothetical protein